MRHRVSSKRLKRTSGELKSLLKNQASQLFERGSVTTTLPKAKILRPFAEKLVTLAKDTGFNSVKKVKAVLVNDPVVRNLFDNVAPKFLQRPGGYTRIVRLGVRQGDNAPMARIELVEKATATSEVEKKKVKNAKN
ncbi:50S ribosomal protein L17 [candidate division WWE3 bacterium CG08_land_8_20_14_0_20_41_10]|uniref:Large ribosomal subunit protein bL17 n=1 Tax=candidate division WWE3 bacterium CG08_land_8_20_14_0_20_41_10 TaxID=1975085 RepID=A0A2H0XBT5_UNCKA|nr:MAG: 50S ribosomal protein L17 [candidate division WWE3 bacterium CG08_land_8_20_14_0_20_41_10]